MSARTSPAKDRQFSFTLSTDELLSLHQVADADGQSAAQWLRATIAERHKAGGFVLPRGPGRNRSWGARSR